MCGIAGFCNPKRDFEAAPAAWTQILTQMNQVQNTGPVDLVRLLQNLRRILQCLFHLLQIFHLLVHKSDLHFQ